MRDTTNDEWKTAREPVFGCELWLGAVNDHGRPIIWRGGKPLSGIREAFARARVAIAPELVPDHLCRRILCVSLDHLEPVTKNENERRKSMRYRLQRRTCRRGHVLNETTRLVTPEMGVLCRVCRAGGTVDAARGRAVEATSAPATSNGGSNPPLDTEES